MYTNGKLGVDKPQDQTEAVEVGNGVTRYDWSIAFSRICMRRKFSAIAIAAAMRLVEELPRSQGECDPHRKDMAAELGRSERQIDRGYAEIEAAGFIKRRKGGSKDATIITLLIPPEDADIHRFGHKSGVGTRDIQASHVTSAHTRHETGPHATQNGSTRDIQRVASKEQKEQEVQSAATPRASEYVDTPVSTMLHLGESAPVGALEVGSLLHEARETFDLSDSQEEPLRGVISNALRNMPRDYVMTHIVASPNYPAFIASLASVGVAITASSS